YEVCFMSSEYADNTELCGISIFANSPMITGLTSWLGLFGNLAKNNWYWSWKKSYKHKDIYVFDVISVSADIHLYVDISSWAVCGYSPLWDFLLSEFNECLGEKAISLLMLDFLYNCDCFILMVMWFPIICLTSELMVCYIDHFHGIFLEDLSRVVKIKFLLVICTIMEFNEFFSEDGVNNTGLESVTNEAERTGVSEVSLDNLENMELIG
ncbi:hypothetical protein Tco_1518848, partial [Tanacetum coccineum]